MQRRDAETQRTQRENQITEKVIGAAIEVHRHLGPGLLEAAYEECLCHELSQAGLRFTRQTSVPVTYKGLKLNCGFRLDLLIEDLVIVEVKAVESLLPVHEAQLLTYLKLLDTAVGLLINFHEPMLKTGIRRVVHNFMDSSASPRLCVEEGLPDAPALS
jgi:GxxExxY protein